MRSSDVLAFLSRAAYWFMDLWSSSMTVEKLMGGSNEGGGAGPGMLGLHDDGGGPDGTDFLGGFIGARTKEHGELSKEPKP